MHIIHKNQFVGLGHKRSNLLSKINPKMLYGKIITIYYENHMDTH